jgi:O-acetylhomoserine/O-acetylserine sulfhydrylase-like pyridoxal-dependent enzyme
MNHNKPNPGTLSVWAGEEKYLVAGATQVPVVHSVSFGYDDVDHWLRVALGKEPDHIYSRNANPTVHAFEEKVRYWEASKLPLAPPPAWALSAAPYSPSSPPASGSCRSKTLTATPT